MSSDPSSRNNPGLSQGGHPSSYNPNRPGLTSEISGEMTAYAISALLTCMHDIDFVALNVTVHDRCEDRIQIYTLIWIL